MVDALSEGQTQVMPTYEINLWSEKKIIEKGVKQFETDDDVLDFKEKF